MSHLRIGLYLLWTSGYDMVCYTHLTSPNHGSKGSLCCKFELTFLMFRKITTIAICASDKLVKYLFQTQYFLQRQ